jgi:hypothetical protein
MILGRCGTAGPEGLPPFSSCVWGFAPEQRKGLPGVSCNVQGFALKPEDRTLFLATLPPKTMSYLGAAAPRRVYGNTAVDPHRYTGAV